MIRSVLVPLFTLALFGLASASAEPYSSGSAADVMKNVVTTYQKLSTYRDRGRSVETLPRGDGEKEASTKIIQFTTLFKRAGGYRFVWTATHNFFGKDVEASSNRFWSDGSTGWYSESSYNSKPQVSKMGLAAASAASTGISQGTSHDIFRLLSDEVTGFRYDELTDLRIARSEVVLGVESYVVHGNYVNGTAIELWIGEKDYLIRRGAETESDGTTTVFERSDIAVNVDIPELEFTKRP